MIRSIAVGTMFLTMSALSRAQTPADSVPATPRYAATAAALTRYIEAEMADKSLPALSIAIVEGDTIVWARGFGFANPRTKVPATARTIYRVGSVSKLFTDIGVMQLVERGTLDLDGPVTRYVGDVMPTGGAAITLRQLMSHRSGILREPPRGHYFDNGNTSLAETIQSLKGTSIVYPVGTKAKYSNAGVAVAGVRARASREREVR